MTAPEQQAVWLPPIGTKVTITNACCGQILAENRITWDGEPHRFVIRGCPNATAWHTSNVTYSWSLFVTTPEQPDLRQRIAEALMRWAEDNNNPSHAPLRRPKTVTRNAYDRADAVLAVAVAA